MEAFASQLNIKIIMVSPTNHKSLLAEHGIKSLSGLLVMKFGHGMTACHMQCCATTHIAHQT